MYTYHKLRWRNKWHGFPNCPGIRVSSLSETKPFFISSLEGWDEMQDSVSGQQSEQPSPWTPEQGARCTHKSSHNRVKKLEGGQ